MPNEEEMDWEPPSQIVCYEEKGLWPVPLKGHIFQALLGITIVWRGAEELLWSGTDGLKFEADPQRERDCVL